MSQLEPYRGIGGLTRDTRRASRTISRHHVDGQVRVSQIDIETDVTMAKVDAITTATGCAMTAVTRVAQAQKQFELLVPDASGRLAFLADDHVLACGDVLQDLRCQMRRR